MENMNRILIVSYFFPPFPRVAARRWAKIGRYLFEKGYHVHVLYAKDPSHPSSPFDEEAEKIRLKTAIDIKIPYHYRNKAPKTILQKLRYHLSKWLSGYLKVFTAGNYEDTSGKYKQIFYDKAKKIIEKEKIDTVIVSVGPYHYAQFMPYLKKDYPHISLMLDVRDFWADWLNKLSAKRKLYEQDMEESFFRNYDKILFPADILDEAYRIKYPNMSNKFHIIRHYYDPEYVFPVSSDQDTSRDISEIKFLYLGSLYSNFDFYFENFILFLKKIQNESNVKVLFNIYTSFNSYQNIVEKHEATDIVKYHAPINTNQINKEMQSHDFMTYFRKDDLPYEEHILSTKFYEYLGAKKPIVYIGPKGKVDDFISKNNIGVSIDSEGAMTKIFSYLNVDSETKIDIDTSKWSLESTCREIEEILPKDDEIQDNFI
jgi:glycosyltransferase involved in cell wall biosynthesis